ncbi:MAG: hypothetical protein Q4F83_11035 [Eubacteriales bacterium]|nr:hypothetical protein [Eubacteriales bacterium]
MNDTSTKCGAEKREQILQYIIAYISQHGYPPTLREIGKGVGLKSTSSVQSHLNWMFACGTLETDAAGSPRAIRVPGYGFIREEE